MGRRAADPRRHGRRGRAAGGRLVATFGLVHGAWHGAWCWERLIPELKRRGHRAIAADLPLEVATAGADAYRDAVIDSLADAEDPILVGHSLGGLTIPRVALLRPVRRLVYLSALLPVPGLAYRDQGDVALVPGFGAGAFPDSDHCSYWPTPESAVEGMYADCDPELARWAAARLRRQCYRILRDPFEAWPGAPATYVVAQLDACISPEWSRAAARERLRVEPLELAAGHSSYLTDPGLVADLLSSVAGSS